MNVGGAARSARARWIAASRMAIPSALRGLLIVGLTFLSLNPGSSAASDEPAIDQPAAAPYRIVWVGDILLGDAAQQLVETHGFDWPFQHLSGELEGDFVVGNQEGPISTRTTPHFPDARWSYNASPGSADALARVGFDAVSLANNHAFDRGPDGLADTIEHLERAGIEHFGAGMSLDKAARPLLIATPHGTVGVLGFSQGGQHRPAAGPAQAGLLEINESSLSDHRQRALDAGARWVVAYVHWGSNYAPIRSVQRRAAAAFSAAGYDLVIGHHPHMVQPIEHIGQMPVLYSLGNFVFGSRGRFTSEFPGYGLVARSIIDESGMTLELSCIVTDNKKVKFQPRPCPESEARLVIEGLGPSVTWSDGKGVMQVK